MRKCRENERYGRCGRCGLKLRVETGKFNVKKKHEYYASNKGTAKTETTILTLLRILESCGNCNRTVLITWKLLRSTVTSATKLLKGGRKKYRQERGINGSERDNNGKYRTFDF